MNYFGNNCNRRNLVSFQAQPSRDRDDICSPSQDVEPTTGETFLGVTSDLDIIYEVKPTVVPTESLCVPYTTQIDGNYFHENLHRYDHLPRNLNY